MIASKCGIPVECSSRDVDTGRLQHINDANPSGEEGAGNLLVIKSLCKIAELGFIASERSTVEA